MITITVIIPVYNEEKTIQTIISKVKTALPSKKFKKQIIVVDDASKDKTAEMLNKMSGISVFRHSINKGKGAAIRTALAHVTGEIVIIQDADLEYNPHDLNKLIKPIARGKAKVVYGTRLKHYPLTLVGAKKTPLITHYFGNKLLSFVTSVLYFTTISDMETCYKVFTKDVVNSMVLKSNRFEFEPEFTAKVLKKGIRILEIPITVTPRGYDDGKKISWKDGFIALWTLIKYRFID